MLNDNLFLEVSRKYVCAHRKILVVDDEPDITSLFRKVLMREGFRVDVYNDLADSLKNFKSHFYDLIILDIIIPDMDGF